MISPQLLVLGLVLWPSLASAALFPSDSLVKIIDAKGFKKAMQQNQTSAVAFVASWCGHCQKAAPEYSKAAVGLHPLVPLYAVDCGEEKNKRLCGEQGVKGFPTFKLYPRGNQLPPVEFQSERSANSFFNWISRGIPTRFRALTNIDEIHSWVGKNKRRPRALLMMKEKNVPLLWKVLANKYGDQITFGTHIDIIGKSSATLGIEDGKGKSKVVIYARGSQHPALYDGATKFDSLSRFFESVVDGTAELNIVTPHASEAIIIERSTPVAAETDQIVLETETTKQTGHETATEAGAEITASAVTSEESSPKADESTEAIPEPSSRPSTDKTKAQRSEDEL